MNRPHALALVFHPEGIFVSMSAREHHRSAATSALVKCERLILSTLLPDLVLAGNFVPFGVLSGHELLRKKE
jgi:hypothetical protein